jgi:hypothetical protein
MDYQKSGIIFYKKNNGKYYFLLAKNNLNILNENNNFYSDIGGSKQTLDFNSKDTAARSFYENTFGLSDPINDLVNKISKSYENKKYKHALHFIESDFSNDIIFNINSVRSYLNQTIINNEDDLLKKKECSLQGCLISNGIKWFELSEIVSNPDNFDKKFMNSFLKSIKKIFMKNKTTESDKNNANIQVQPNNANIQVQPNNANIQVQPNNANIQVQPNNVNMQDNVNISERKYSQIQYHN